MADTEKADGHGFPPTQQHDELAQDHPPHHGMSAGTYLQTRFSSLKPPMTKAPNPIKLLRSISGRQWAFFFVAFAAWTADAFDFFTGLFSP
jgi:SHS family lactate transporter-like MFS transporter